MMALVFLIFIYFYISNIEKHNEYPWKIGEESSIEISLNDPFSLSLVDESIRKSGASFLLTSDASDEAYYGNQYWLQIELDSKWYTIDKHRDWTLEQYILHPEEEVLLEVDWNDFYGELPNGNYRFIKEIADFNNQQLYKSVEFTIQ